MNLRSSAWAAIFMSIAAVACSSAPASEPTGESQSDLVLRPCVFGHICRPELCTVGEACCAGSSCNANSAGQNAQCDTSSNTCEACGGLNQTPCGGLDCYGADVLNASGTCQSCSAVGPSFSISVTGSNSATLQFNLHQAALGQLSVINVATGATVAGWYQVFDYQNTIFLPLAPETTYEVKFTPTVSPTSSGSCSTAISNQFATPPTCTVGGSCQVCSACNDGSCQCGGSITSCANIFAPTCEFPGACNGHNGVNTSVGCQQE